MARLQYGAAKNAGALVGLTSVKSVVSQDPNWWQVVANVMVSVKIFPSDIVSDMSGLQDKIRKTLEGKASVYKFEEEPVAFGLVALIAHIVMPENIDGRMDEVEERLKSLDGISEVQVLVSRRV